MIVSTDENFKVKDFLNKLFNKLTFDSKYFLKIPMRFLR